MLLKVVSIQIMNKLQSTLPRQFMGRNNRVKIGSLLSATFHDTLAEETSETLPGPPA